MRNTTIILIIIYSLQTSYSQTCSPPFFTTQQQIDDFSTNYPGCVEIVSDFRVLESTPGEIVNLNGLSQVTTLSGGSNWILNNSNLTNLNGLNISIVNGPLRIANNPSLASIAGLSNLNTITGQVLIEGNSNLTSLSGLNNLATVGGSLIIGSNSLSNLSGLDNLTSIAANAGQNSGLQIRNSTTLTSLTGLSSSLTHIDGSLWIRDNTALTSLIGLEGITSLDDFLYVSGNTGLTSLQGIENIDPLTINAPSGTDLIISNNPDLSSCAILSICDYLDLPGMSTFVSNNSNACNSVTEIETACSSLPVEWLKPLTCRERENTVKVNFATVQQVNNSHFDIERSINARHFDKIGEIKGEGTTSTENYYSFIDTKPANGINYYRVRQVDYDGKYEYSNVASIIFESNETRIYPNPSSNLINIQSVYHQEIVIFNQLGEIVRKALVEKGENHMDISELPSGTYYFKIGEKTELLVKE